MITEATVSAVRLLLYLGSGEPSGPVSLRRAADELGESASYLSKVTNRLVRAGIVRSHRGAMGGIELKQSASEISLLSVVEACQGSFALRLVPDVPGLEEGCAFQRAMAELGVAILEVLSRWTLGRMLEEPGAGICRLHHGAGSKQGAARGRVSRGSVRAPEALPGQAGDKRTPRARGSRARRGNEP